MTRARGMRQRAIMSQSSPPSDLAAQVARLWSEPTAKPRPILFLAPPGRESGELLTIAQGLGIAHIRLDLGQVVTPEQHMLLSGSEPRMVAIFGIDRLGEGERGALVRLLGGGPRTLPVIICPIPAEKESGIRRAFRQMRAMEAAERDQRATVEASA